MILRTPAEQRALARTSHAARIKRASQRVRDLAAMIERKRKINRMAAEREMRIPWWD